MISIEIIILFNCMTRPMIVIGKLRKILRVVLNMKKTSLVLFGFVVFSLLPSRDLYAGKVIDKSQDGYLLSVPKVIASGKKIPVLVCLPGLNVPAKQDINVWSFPANKVGFLVLNLDINYNLIKSDQNVEDLYQRMTTIINSLSVTYPINTDKIYIAGTSAGGMMTISLALRHPERFSAIGVVSGAEFRFGAENYLSKAKGGLFYMIHGRKDKIVSIGKFYATKQQLEENGALIEFKVVPEGGHTLRSGEYKEVVDALVKAGKSIPEEKGVQL